MARSLGSSRYYDEVAQPITQDWEGNPLGTNSGDNQAFFTFDGAASGTRLDIDSTAKELVILQGDQYLLKAVDSKVFIEIASPPPAGETATVTAATTAGSFPLEANREYVFNFSQGQKLSLIAAANDTAMDFIPSVIN